MSADMSMQYMGGLAQLPGNPAPGGAKAAHPAGLHNFSRSAY